jgi:S-adenosylmethionine hydrolase
MLFRATSDQASNRLANSEKSYTFHGRDVYAYTGARLAAGVIRFQEVGPELKLEVERIPYQKPVFNDGRLKGNIEILDPQYGNIWTNIDRNTFEKMKLTVGDRVNVSISNSEEVVLEISLPYFLTFGGVRVAEPLLYLNSLNRVALAINQGNFSDTYKVGSGPAWSITISKYMGDPKDPVQIEQKP